ncbi:MAG: tyrosine-type recombinase/integrase [Candidatus Nitrosotenuis sp.]|uniref:Tyr recombinase domain-containing protein n=1 Tax=Candidatus Nitrosotenuis uzonensis TaxID=1407055 RepID=A0A812F611_9ARCH|nr:tyrosine-type recombinase/integrase [Candidatus Nitrosotenuis uzonensis]CAE6500831.1 conserved hypothetical protein [Candidatus Nitrosotenuis uzonensis]
MKQTLKNRLKADIHNYDKRIGSVLRRIENALSKQTVELIRKYHSEMISESISKATQLKHLEVLLNLSRFLKKEWGDVTADDIQRLVIRIIQEYSPSGQETHTTADHKKVLKIFFRWYKTGSRRKDPDALDPVEIRKIRLKRVKDRLSREDLISDSDMTKILHACGENLRDKALIAVHNEAGTRIGETLTLQIKHVSIDKYGAIIKVDGKTNARPIRLLISSPYLISWMNAHPFKDDPESPLWINISKYQYGSQLTYKGARQIIQKRVELANLPKRVYFHLFRHSQITQTANFLTEAQQKKRYGWSSSSKMPARYTHLVDEDVDEALLSHFGITKQKETELKLPRKCPACEWPNAPDVDYCEKCTKPLSLEKALELEQKEKEANQSLQQTVTELQKQVQNLARAFRNKTIDEQTAGKDNNAEQIDNRPTRK